MGGSDDQVAMMGDSFPLDSIPRTLFSSMTNDKFESRSGFNCENQFAPPFPAQPGVEVSKSDASNSNALPAAKPSSVGSLAERMAARAGFSAPPRLNTEAIKPPKLQSPYLTIPPGLSPTSLLESPVFLSNAMLFSTADERQSIEDPLKPQPNKSGLLFDQSNFSNPDKIDCPIYLPDNSSPPPDEHEDEDPTASNCSGEDGYSWRKYGQKHVKGSEYPRSYYKCTHQNCPVKKKVERSHEGHVTEIIYKGAHNHPKPQPARRSGLGPLNAFENMQSISNGNPVWSVMERENFAGIPEWKPDNLEQKSSLQSGWEYSNRAGTTLPAHGGAQCELTEGLEDSSTLSNKEESDGVTHGSVSFGNDGELDESESKRRRMETYAQEVCGATRAIREPRVVVQTKSDVDILDDGYRWRKYGQKVVKGNPNPRSYYKCTSPGCNVRKHVERASHDLKSVITTYEGKHNHNVPTARNSGLNSGGPNTQQAQNAANRMARPEPGPIRGRATSLGRPPLTSFGLLGQPQVLRPGFGFGMNQPGPAGQGLDLYTGNHQPCLANEMGYMMMPKEELKLEPVMDSGLNSAVGFSAYQQLMGRLPLGPQM
ncbi:Probable WRKY transcription factor 34 [Striga hermonthica]|uniref:Probable WRKY transcription factor 34 n=1 Tax=Striga hermonthica TaxID=68872 RepID=A0A9N7MUL3_STRHE|nr:Probable WRKY transcription factor 34 [Striga hermonthica]